MNSTNQAEVCAIHVRFVPPFTLKHLSAVEHTSSILSRNLVIAYETIRSTTCLY